MKTLVIFAALLAAPALFAQAPNAENGKKVFERMLCSACHGHEGQGGGAGPRIGVKPPPMAVMIAYVRHPAGNMPPFSTKVVSDQELADIHAYLASRPAPLPLKEMPLLNQ
jgi:mono/diheme cytochrome c family protein